MSSIPRTTSQWVIESPTGTSGLKLEHSVPIPPLGEHDVLLQVNACSFNARDNQILNNSYIWGSDPGVVPLSDCAGTVLATGRLATGFPVGALCTPTFHRAWTSGPQRHATISHLGAREPGVLARHIVVPASALVAAPPHLSAAEAAALPCAAVTAWSALFGAHAGGRTVRPGDVVLTQGSGGVAVFAIQFARAAGAKVIATTGALGGEKEARLRGLGAHEVLCYNEAGWGKRAREMANGGEGVDFVVETSGAAEETRDAVRRGGRIAIVGGLAPAPGKQTASLWDMRATVAEVVRMTVGSREDAEDMARAIEVNRIRPVVDKEVFEFAKAKEAFEYAASGKAFGNVVIQVS